MINLENIYKKYTSAGKTIHALKGVNLHIDEGEVYGIIGRSGAGKSTLIRMLNLLERPTQGSVFIDGEDITTFSKNKLNNYRHGVGMIFQHFNLLHTRTVLDNVCFPLRLVGIPRAKRRARAMELLQLVGLTGQEKKYPGQLSGGQRQRVGIARALANNPRLLLCDEATSALDPETTQSILSLLRDINEKLNLTIILITHSMDVIRDVCDQVAVIEGGEIIEKGQVVDIFLHPGSETTRALLSESGLDGGDGWRELADNFSGPLVRMSFRGQNTGTPLLSQLSRELDLDFNILQGSVGHIKDTPYGQLIVAVQGDKDNMKALKPALEQANLHYEVLRA